MLLGNVLDLGVPSDNTVSLAKLTATGTKDATTFLRGDNTFAEAGGGKLLQTIQATDSTSRTTTSSSYQVASNTLTVNITPSATTSKILIMMSSSGEVGGNSIHVTVYRDSTELSEGSDTGKGFVNSQGANSNNSIGFTFLDSPSTTSQITYQVKFRSSNGSDTATLNGGCLGTLICQEIGA